VPSAFQKSFFVCVNSNSISNYSVKLVKLPAFSPFSGCVLVFVGILKTIFSCFVKKIDVMKIFVCVYVFYDCHDFYDYCQFHFLLINVFEFYDSFFEL